MEQQNNFDIKKLLAMKTDHIIIKERNKPNLDRMTEAFYKLLMK